MVDAKALKILYATYWSSKGWNSDRQVAAVDYSYAKTAGVMFDAVVLTHDQAVRGAVEACANVDRLQVANAFVASLSTRRLEIRSALGSYAVGRHMKIHSFEDRGPCPECGDYNSSRPNDLNVLNFERFKWGGVRHSNPIYIALDLKLFAETPATAPNPEDCELLENIRAIISAQPSDARPRDMERALIGRVASNKAEREVLLQILSYCSILAPAGRPGFWGRFVPACERDVPPVNKIDWTYPLAWWRGADGLSSEAFDYWFADVCA